MIIVNRNEYIEEEHEKTLEQAKKAMQLYRDGKTAKEVGEALGKSTITIWRYFKVLGGITNKDKGMHMYNRYAK